MSKSPTCTLLSGLYQLLRKISGSLWLLYVPPCSPASFQLWLSAAARNKVDVAVKLSAVKPKHRAKRGFKASFSSVGLRGTVSLWLTPFTLHIVMLSIVYAWIVTSTTLNYTLGVWLINAGCLLNVLKLHYVTTMWNDASNTARKVCISIFCFGFKCKV